MTTTSGDESHKFIASTAIRMADEGIPVQAIARSVRLPLGDVYELLRDAIAEGTIIALPCPDWPVGKSRDQRSIALKRDGALLENTDTLCRACGRSFHTTRLESAFLAVLLQRKELTKMQLHMVSESLRPGDNREPTDPKMVDVIICHIRKKLRGSGVEISTIWGVGYFISPASKHTALSMIREDMGEDEDASNLGIVIPDALPLDIKDLQLAGVDA